MNGTNKQNEWWIYIIFFLIGIFSFLIFFVDQGDLLLPLLICSILFALALYTFKKQSFVFAGMAFAISFAISSATSYLIIFIVYFGSFFIDVWFPLLFFLLILLVFSAIAWNAFKEQPLYNFTLKAFIVSFGTILIIFSAMFITSQQEATSSSSIYIESSAENVTIYVPVLLDENKNALKMYETPEITGNMTTAVINTEYGKALMISNIYAGNNEINMKETHGIKEDTQEIDEFLKGFTISMSNYTPPESQYYQLPVVESWVYSDSEVEKVRFDFNLDPENRIDDRVLSIRTDTGLHLKKGWQVVNISVSISST